MRPNCAEQQEICALAPAKGPVRRLSGAQGGSARASIRYFGFSSLTRLSTKRPNDALHT